MKKTLALVLTLILALSLVACGGADTPNNETSTLPPSTSLRNNEIQAPQSSKPASTQATAPESVSVPVAQAPGLSETEAIAISMGLYENGYCPFLSFLWGFGWGSGIDPEPSFRMDDIIEDMPYYRSTVYSSRAHLEEELGKTFTTAFVQRNTAEFFDGDADGHILLVERDGVLYRREPGGMGGTYALATETIKIENMNIEGWTFTMHGLNPHDDSPLEELVWTFNVTNENGRWLIDSMEGVFSDGSGRQSH